MLNIILINYNSTEDTIQCIKSIFRSVQKNKCGIYIYDNASLEEQVKILKVFLSDVKKQCNDFIQFVECTFGEKNLGFAAANNFYLCRIPFDEYVWILNNDTLVNEQLINSIFNNLPKDNEICYMDCHTFDDNYHDSGLHYTSILTGKNSVKKKSALYVEYVCGASLIAKKTKNLPLWDESYFLYYEDLDYEFQLRKKNFKHKKIENCYFQHKIGGSAKKQTSYNLIQLRSQILFMKRYSVCYPFFHILDNDNISNGHRILCNIYLP